MNRNRSGRRYDREFKNDAVALVRAGRTITEVARDLGVSKWSLGHWVRRAEEGQMLSEPKTLALETPEQRERRRLRQELEYVSRQRDILKKPWASCRRRRHRALHADGKARASIWRRRSE
jgi:transposase-like protein